MSEELLDEIVATNAIYGYEALQSIAQDTEICVLSLPAYSVALRIRFPNNYPSSPPEITGTESTGPQARKGYGTHVLELARDILSKVRQPGQVCVFDLIQELESLLGSEKVDSNAARDKDHDTTLPPEPERKHSNHSPDSPESAPTWTISQPTTIKHSTFIAHACHVSSPAQARQNIAHLLATDKRVAKATHNITAYRIRGERNEVVYQDCDDDGETAAGGRLLHLMQVMGCWGVLVVLSRWYGGVQLGPDRFRVMGQVAREVLAEGKFGEGR